MEKMKRMIAVRLLVVMLAISTVMITPGHADEDQKEIDQQTVEIEGRIQELEDSITSIQSELNEFFESIDAEAKEKKYAGETAS
jgi:uncharacterized protein YlxW (UPF0749 family)